MLIHHELDISLQLKVQIYFKMETDSKTLVVLGDAECGKTRLLTVFSNHKFNPDLPTLRENYVTQNEIDGKPVTFTLRDSIGKNDYERLKPLSYPDIDVILLCFSIECPHTLHNTLLWFPEIKHIRPDVPIILVGTKKDLRTNPETISALAKKKEKPVKTEEGLAVAKKIGAVTYVECSAKTKVGIRKVFETASKASLYAASGF